MIVCNLEFLDFIEGRMAATVIEVRRGIGAPFQNEIVLIARAATEY